VSKLKKEETRGSPLLNGAAGRVDRPFAARKTHSQRHFERTCVWIFDLDNTLYPAACNLFAEVDVRMTEFIAQQLGVPMAYARHLQKSYYKQFGTTLSGLMRVHKFDPQPFLDYVHNIDLSVIDEAPDLAAAIEALPGRRLIYTNGSHRHAERVAEKLGVLHLFEDICDIAACEFVAKPDPDAFNRMMRRHNVGGVEAAMFEDMPHNLEAPHMLGMTTVLVQPDHEDHPAHVQIRGWETPPEHIHHTTDDLARFLEDIQTQVSKTAPGSNPTEQVK